MVETKDQAVEAQQTFFRVTDNVPEEAWYWAALGSIGISAMLKLSGKDDWAIFVGQWPPTLILMALVHKLLQPSAEPGFRESRQAVSEAARMVQGSGSGA